MEKNGVFFRVLSIKEYIQAFNLCTIQKYGPYPLHCKQLYSLLVDYFLKLLGGIFVRWKSILVLVYYLLIDQYPIHYLKRRFHDK